MLSVLGIIASPRKLGNCEIMVKEVARSIEKPHELNLLRLTDYRIQYCKACYRCLVDDEKCPIDDDLYFILESIKSADVILVASPAYFLGPHSSLKRFIDRGLSFYAYVDHFWRTPAAAIGVAGIQGREGHTLLGVENFLKMIFSDIKSSQIFYGALPGEVLLDEDNKSAARHLAKSLFHEDHSSQSTSFFCSFCKGETFRFIGEKRVQCALCSNYGSLSFDSGKPLIVMEKGPHELLMNKKDVLEHRKWLLQMKSRFMEKKSALKKVALNYRHDGKWVTSDT